MPEGIKNEDGSQDTTNTGTDLENNGQESLNSDGQESEGEANWYDGLSEERQTGAKDFKDMNAFVDDMHSKVTVVPEEYDIKAPEGQTLDEGAMNRVKPFAKEIGLSNEQLQKVVDFELQIVGEQRKQVQEAKNKAETELKTDWGNEYEGNLKKAVTTMQKLFDDSFVNFLETSGLGNRTEMVRAMFQLDKVISEDGIGIDTLKKPANQSKRDSLGLPIINDYDYMDNE